jgi:hypothetical protein
MDSTVAMFLIIITLMIFWMVALTVGVLLAYLTDWDDRLGKKNKDRDKK